MNKRSFRRVAVFAGTAALAGGAVAGCGSQAASTTSRQQTAQPAGQPPGSGDDMAAALAKELGVSEAKVKAALEKVRPQGGPGNGQAPTDSGTAATSSKG
jgi:hypothetical protein